jgi:hypothetical protein
MADQRYIPDVCSGIDFHLGLLQAGAGKERPMKVIKDGNRPTRDHLPKPRMLPRGKRTQQPPRARARWRLSIKRDDVSSGGCATVAPWRTRESADGTRNEAPGNSSEKIAQRKAASKQDSGDAPRPSAPGSEPANRITPRSRPPASKASRTTSWPKAATKRGPFFLPSPRWKK